MLPLLLIPIALLAAVPAYSQTSCNRVGSSIVCSGENLSNTTITPLGKMAASSPMNAETCPSTTMARSLTLRASPIAMPSDAAKSVDARSSMGMIGEMIPGSGIEMRCGNAWAEGSNS